MSERIICPTCRTGIEIGTRCTSEHAGYVCMETVGHDGFHWADQGTYALIWHGPYHGHSCHGRLSLDRWCTKPPGHDGWHNDGHGMSWADEPVSGEG